MNIAVIVNPKANAGHSLTLFKQYQQLLQQTVGPYDTFMTAYAKEATILTHNALQQGYDYIICFGGDGTLNEVINGFFDNDQLINPNAMLSPIMTGTGCDFKRSLPHYAHSIKESITRLSNPNVLNIDVLKLTDSNGTVHYSDNITSVGLGAAVSNVVNHSFIVAWLKHISPKATYFLASLMTLLFFRNKSMTYIIESSTHHAKCKEIIIANGQYYGGGIRIAPEAKLDSQQLNIVVLKHFSLIEFLWHNKKFYNGTHLALSKVEHHHTSSITIEARHAHINVDGEVWGHQPLHIGVANQTIKVLY